ncbi:MAG: hypothetical protein NZ898_00070 [Myxococcota bacterium]|nr:hypothetical protein [Myxococcota bacterium]MDW8361679.1 hypothetical protein [Myxococcales bacterium]
MGGGGAGFGPPPGGEGPAEPPKKKSKTLLFVGIGCLALLFCVLAGWAISCFVCKKAAETAGSAFAVEIQRIPLVATLGGIRMSCVTDPSGASAAQYFHPNVFPQLQAQACAIDDNVLNAYSEPNRSQAATARGSPYEATITGLGLQLDGCAVFSSGASRIVGCSDPSGRYLIVHAENIAQVQ